MTPFHVMIHGRPSELAPRPPALLSGASLRTFEVQVGQTLPGLGVAFEELVARLATLPRIYIEPDGALVWAAASPAPWQIYGMLWDRGAEVSHVELQGKCPRDAVAQFLKALGRNPDELLVQLVHQGLFVDVASFIDWMYGNNSNESLVDGP